MTVDCVMIHGSNLDKLAISLCDRSEIQCKRCKDDVELVNIASKYIGLLSFKRYKTKEDKDLDERVLHQNFKDTYGYCGCYENFLLMDRKGVYPQEHMNS